MSQAMIVFAKTIPMFIGAYAWLLDFSTEDQLEARIGHRAISFHV